MALGAFVLTVIVTDKVLGKLVFVTNLGKTNFTVGHFTGKGFVGKACTVVQSDLVPPWRTGCWWLCLRMTQT